MAAIRSAPAGMSVLSAFRSGMRESVNQLPEDTWADLTERTQLALTVPAVRARFADELLRTADVMAEAVGDRTGRGASDPLVRTFTGALLGAAMIAFYDAHFYRPGFCEGFAPPLQRLAAGLTL